VGRSISRRDVLGNIVCAGTGVLLVSGKTSAKTGTIRIAGRPVEVGLAQVSPRTIRLSVVAIENGQPKSIPNDGSIVQQAWSSESIRFSALSGEKQISFARLTVTISPDPLTIIVYENHRLVQRLAIDQQHLELANGQGRPAATPVAHRSVAALATRVDPPIPRYLGNPEHPARSRAPGRGPEWRDHYWLSCPDYSRHRLG